MNRSAARNVRAELEPLVRELAALSEDERRAVVSAAETTARSRHACASWKTIRKLTGVLSIGGNAIDDCARLYDG